MSSLTFNNNHFKMILDSQLKKFERFGINLGLERIQTLLEKLGNPHHQVPIIHVAGTNGKGSVCAYLSAILTAANLRVGRYISPHLVDWTERICLNETPIVTEILQQLIQQIQNTISPDCECPTQFEVITAAAWLYFAQQKVDIAVMEVGLGGRLDATNVCDHPLVTVITPISREHWQRLGPTVAHIAREKAGILKPGCPAVIAPQPPEAMAVIQKRLTELNCPAVFPQPAQVIGPQLAVTNPRPVAFQGVQYPLPLLGEVQLLNSALAVAAIQVLQNQGWEIPNTTIAAGMAQTKWPGRLQWTEWRGHPLLIDGAHNPAAAQVLRQYVDTLPPQPVNWVMGMLSTKDHADIFQALLRAGDRLWVVPVPDHSSGVPGELAELAQTVCPGLELCQACDHLTQGLELAFSGENHQTVLCGSLYLIGHFFQDQSKAY